ncbi:MAG: hypothetical protein IH628_12680 [Proteobacteria bacterium]|nr:hypothetical protein [Pseudomonadota bacterium]
MKAKLRNVQGKGPIQSAKSGRFDVSVWHWKRTIAPPKGMEDFSPEQEKDVTRACIRLSHWNRATRIWDEELIWCNVDDLRSLVQALDGLNVEE